jgi:hypothetical protein
VSSDDVQHATWDDLRIGQKAALRRLGCTYAELEAQHASGDFDSLAHRLTWMAYGDLGDLNGPSAARAELAEALTVERFTRHVRANPDPPAEVRFEALLLPRFNDDPTLFDQAGEEEGT